MAPAKEPTAIPIIGDHNRQAGGPLSTSPATTRMVIPTEMGAAPLETPSGTSFRMSNITGMIVTAISMITVPDTTGVNIRLSSDSREASRI